MHWLENQPLVDSITLLFQARTKGIGAMARTLRCIEDVSVLIRTHQGVLEAPGYVSDDHDNQYSVLVDICSCPIASHDSLRTFPGLVEPLRDLVRLAVERGADVNALGVHGKPVLFTLLRVWECSPHLLALLVELGAEIGVEPGCGAAEASDLLRVYAGDEVVSLLSEGLMRRRLALEASAAAAVPPPSRRRLAV